MPQSPRRPKALPESSITGQKGINIIERIVLEMGCLWISRVQFDAGIDGYIELRDATTGVVSGSHIAVQSKCGPSYFKNESTEEFTFQPDERDLGSWRCPWGSALTSHPGQQAFLPKTKVSSVWRLPQTFGRDAQVLQNQSCQWWRGQTVRLERLVMCNGPVKPRRQPVG